MRKIVVLLLFTTIYSCGIPSLVRSPLELLTFFRFFFFNNSQSKYSLGGTVSGLVSGASVKITNDSETITVSSDGNFTFPNKLSTGTPFKVSFIATGTPLMECSIANGAGTIQTSDITNVSITCGWGPNFYEVGVSITGITGTVNLQLNGTESLAVTSTSLTKFSTRIETGLSYAVTISSQSAGSVCSFEDPTLTVGTMAAANITLFLRCVNGYLNGGTIHSVAAADLVNSEISSQNFYLRTMVGSFPINTGGLGANFGTVNAMGDLARFHTPKGIASDGSFVYVADSFFNLIRKIDATNGNTTTFAGGNAGGGIVCPGTTTINCKDGIGADAQFNQPFALTTDGTSLYVLEFSGNRIRKINLATAQVTTLAGNGDLAPFADNANGILASFNNPHGITLYNGMLYVADRYNHRIRAVNPVTSAVTTLAGNAIASYADLNGTSAQFSDPIGIVGLNGYLYVTDTVNERIRRIDLSGANPVTTIAGNGTSASVDGYATNAKFDGPFSITTDGTNLFVSDYGTYKIRHLRLIDGKVTTLVGGSGYADNPGSNGLMSRPVYLTSDGKNVYISEEGNHAIRRIENAEQLRYTFDGNSNDSIGTNHGTPVGAISSTSDENGSATGAYEFNGVNNYINSTSNVIFNGNAITDNLTISAWINPSGGATDQFIFYNGLGGTNGYGLIFQASTRYIYISLGGVGSSGLGTRKLPLNQWSHVAITRNTGNWQIHINGVSEGIGFNTNPIPPAASFKVGDAGNGFYFKGKISDVRFFKGALDAPSLQKLAVQVPSGLLAYYPFNGNLNDYSGNENHLTPFGTPFLVSDRNELANSAYTFVAPNDYLEKASPYGLPETNSSRTNCAWVRATSTPSNVISYGFANNSQGNGIAIGNLPVNPYILHYGWGNDQATNHFYLVNRWVHICGTYNGVNSDIYYNGAYQSSSPLGWITSVSAALRIGRRIDNGEFFNGEIDDVRIYNRVLSANEIRALSGNHPLQINDLHFHLQAETISNFANEPNVTEWIDNSPNNALATSVGGNSVVDSGFNPSWNKTALLGKPAVIFNGSQVLSKINAPYTGLTSNAFTIFLVNYRIDTTGGGYQVPLTIGPIASLGKAFIYQNDGAGECGNAYHFSLYDGGNCYASSNVGFSVPNEFRLFSLLYNESAAIANPFVWNDSGFVGANSIPFTFTIPSGTDGIFVGASNSVADKGFKGGISEIIYYNRLLSTTESNSVRCYLSSKYNVVTANTCP
jgi:hypothetical protein